MIKKSLKNNVARIMFSSSGFPAWALSQAFAQLPEDAVMIRHIEDPSTACWGWIIQSEKFPDIPTDMALPSIGVRVDGLEKKVTITLPTIGGGLMDDLKDL